MAQNVKTVLGTAIANVKTFCGVPIANCKTIMGVDNGGAPFTYYSAAFDGSDVLKRGGDFTGIADSKVGLVSFWMKATGDGSLRTILRNTSGYFTLELNTLDLLSIRAFSPDGNLRLDLVSNRTVVAADGWVWVGISWDLGTAGRSYIYIDGIDCTTRNTHSDAVLELTNGEWAVGARTDDTFFFTGLLCELYFTTPAAWFDITNSTNRDKFYNSGTSKPESLGSDGSVPTGTQPILYLKSQPPDWEPNAGSGGDMTATGTIADGGVDKP